MSEVFFLQQDYVVGGIAHNARLIIDGCQQARATGSRIAITPELALCGYLPEDNLYSVTTEKLVQKNLQTICQQCPAELALLLGLPEYIGGRRYNSVALIRQHKVEAIYRKVKLPNTSVFDECRYFTAATNPPLIFYVDKTPYTVQICEDLWHPDQLQQLQDINAQNIIAINGSPFYGGKQQLRERTMQQISARLNTAVYYINGVGGQDELVFDGASFKVDANGKIAGRLPAFTATNTAATHTATYPDHWRAIYLALVSGLQAYFYKAGFSNGVLLGLSGGIDSALVATLAADAVGAQRVHAVMLPSQYTSPRSLADAQQLADNLGIHYHTLPISDITATCQHTLTPLLNDYTGDTTAENLQARTRGMMLMALSNNWQQLLLATGNKTEIACGYATLYGDMCGGFAPIKDLLKTEVWALSRAINEWAGAQRIPTAIIDRPPTAELRAGQTDQDTLPPYDLLDNILNSFFADNNIAKTMTHYPPDTCLAVAKLLRHSEFKRQQGAIGTKISPVAFGKDWRMTVANARFDEPS